MKCIALVVFMALAAANAQVIVSNAYPYPALKWSAWNTLTNGAYHPLQGARLAYDPVAPIAYDALPAVYPAAYPAVYPGIPGAYSPPIVVDSNAKTTIKSFPGVTVLKAEAPEMK